jgi:hypothetical protein
MLLILGGVAYTKASRTTSSAGVIAPENMPRIGTVDDRFQSYNIEMVEVTGGRFWKPYKDIDALLKTRASARQSGSNQPAGMSPDLYQYRPPIDLSKARLRTLSGQQFVTKHFHIGTSSSAVKVRLRPF